MSALAGICTGSSIPFSNCICICNFFSVKHCLLLIKYLYIEANNLNACYIACAVPPMLSVKFVPKKAYILCVKFLPKKAPPC